MLDQILTTTGLQIASNGEFDVAIVAVIGGLSLCVIAIVFGTMYAICNKRQEEQTKREIAAYVAEGTISPADAETIIQSKPKS